MKEQVEKEVIVALKHTQKTEKIRDELVEVHDVKKNVADQILARNDGKFLRGDKMDYEISSDDFDEEVFQEVPKPEENPGVVSVKAERRTVEEQKTGLVCKGKCVESEDEIIW